MNRVTTHYLHIVHLTDKDGNEVNRGQGYIVGNHMYIVWKGTPLGGKGEWFRLGQLELIVIIHDVQTIRYRLVEK